MDLPLNATDQLKFVRKSRIHPKIYPSNWQLGIRDVPTRGWVITTAAVHQLSSISKDFFDHSAPTPSSVVNAPSQTTLKPERVRKGDEKKGNRYTSGVAGSENRGDYGNSTVGSIQFSCDHAFLRGVQSLNFTIFKVFYSSFLKFHRWSSSRRNFSLSFRYVSNTLRSISVDRFGFSWCDLKIKWILRKLEIANISVTLAIFSTRVFGSVIRSSFWVRVRGVCLYFGPFSLPTSSKDCNW